MPQNNEPKRDPRKRGCFPKGTDNPYFSHDQYDCEPQEMEASMTTRDPRREPKAGDVLRQGTEVRLVSLEREFPVKGLVWYKTASEDRCNCYVENWERWAKDAEVLNAAD